MSIGLFNFHSHGTDLSKGHEERLIDICMNRYKSCQMDASSHQYVLDPKVENGNILQHSKN
jgi:hypothetical protein